MNCSAVAKKLFRLISWITVEPVQFLYCLMFTTCNIVRDNLFTEKVCILDLGYSEELCSNLTKDTSSVNDSIVAEIQDRVAELEAWDGFLVAVPSVFFCLFVGTWSDYNGRKLVLILPFVGNILSYIAYMLNLYFFYELNTNYLLLGSVLGLFGSYTCLNLGLYGYVSDVTSDADRTTRLGVLNGVFSAAYVVGTTMGAQLYKNVGNYYVIFGISCLIGVTSILYTIFFVEESVSRSQEERESHRFFDLGNIAESLKVAIKPRPQNGRLRILLLIANFSIFMFPLNTSHFDYMLTQLKFDWTITEYSNYLSVQRIFRMLGLFVLLPICSKALKIQDGIISSSGTLITTAAYMLIALGNYAWMMYLSAALQLNSVITVIIRSQCTKSVEVTEIGRIFSVIALGQSLVPMFVVPLFGVIYKATLDTMPGAYLIIVVSLLFLAFLISLYLVWDDRRILRQRPLENDVEEAKNDTEEIIS